MLRRRSALLGLLACTALVTAGCVDVNFNVTKAVSPEGASVGPFTVHIDCQPTVLPVVGEGEPTEGQDDETSESPSLTPVGTQEFADIVFNGPGTELSQDFDDESTCLITEPESAGAIQVTFACTGVTPVELTNAVTCTNVPNGLQVVIGDIGATQFDDVTVDILVTNFFQPPADPASAIVVGPTFTG